MEHPLLALQQVAVEMGVAYDPGMSHLEMGMRLGDHHHLKDAETIFSEIGAQWDLEQTRRLLEPFVERKAV